MILENDPNQYLFYTDTYIELGQYDPLFGRWEHKEVLTRFFRDFLLAHEPDIVHLQHLNFLGYDLVRVVKNTLPDVPIVFTLHEYGPICHRDGQMVRTFNSEAVPGGVAASLQRVLPGGQPAGLLHAQAVHPVPPEARRPLHRARPSTSATATSTGASRPTGSRSSRRA